MYLSEKMAIDYSYWLGPGDCIFMKVVVLTHMCIGHAPKDQKSRFPISALTYTFATIAHAVVVST